MGGICFSTLVEAAPIRFAQVIVPTGGLVEIAEQEKFFQSELVDVNLRRFKLGREALDALVAGEVDVAVAYDTPILDLMHRGVPVKILAAIQSNRGDISMFVSNGIKTPTDLKGKRVGFLFGTSSAYFYNLFLRRHGIAQREVTAVNLPIDKIESALKSKRVDAVIARFPVSHRFKEIEVRKFDLDIYKANVFLVAMKPLIESRSEDIKKVLKALRKAESYFYEDPQRGWKQICKTENLLDQKDQMACMDIPFTAVYRMRVELSNVVLNSLETQESLTKFGPLTLAKFHVKDGIESRLLKMICGECVLF